uniref:Crystaline entomocidal protoxin n=1 Tax=Bacillus thuringiensis TaxID=1428 RepID=Q6BE09_BACTU|nr:cancer cell-killing Cry protein parasporin-3 [Bacillus thuringiensis]BAD35160.1 cancer cell-killing Cry protein parasporin-3 [Bacillus thuringiensis]
MNQNCNNNGYEVLNSGKGYCQPRYPFAQAPGSELQNMGYKEWMNMCTSGDPTVLGEGYSADVRDAVITSINIASYLLSVPFPPAGVAAGILGALLGLLWPTNTQAVWEAFMNTVEALINQKLDEYARSKAISELNGLKNVLELYQDAADDWNENPGDLRNKNRVLTEFRNVNGHFENSMPSFAVRNFEVNLLPVYAEAANLHLLLLRDAVKFGEGWGMSTDPGAERDDMYRRLRSRTEIYTDHCVNTYNQGLQQAKSLQANVSDYSRYPWTQYNQSGGFSYREAKGEYRGTENWNLYNAFRRDMTILVLDIIAQFPTYDPGLYSRPVKSELTREVYTDIRGTTWRSDANLNTIDAIENRMVGSRQLQLFTWLTEMKFYIRNTGSITSYTHGDLMVGLEKKIRKTNDNDQWLPLEGQNTSYTRIDRPGIELGKNYWYYARTQQWFETRLLQLWANTDVLSLNAGTVGNEFWVRDVPDYRNIYARSTRNHFIENHRLSWIKFEPVRDNCPFAWPGYKQLSALLFGWTHNSVDLNNIISQYRITQIPAVKAYWNRGAFSVIRGPGSTGGNLVQLGTGGEVSVKVRPEQTGSDWYRVRIRYAAGSRGRLNVKKYVSSIHASVTYDYNMTMSSSTQGTYNSFQYLDVYNFRLAEPEFEVWLTNESGGPIWIDKIEFIPLSPIPELPVYPGTYQIVTALNNSSVVTSEEFCMGIGLTTRCGVNLWSNNGNTLQKWRFVYNGDQNAFQIKSTPNEDLVLSGSNSGTSVTAETNQNRPNQYWLIEEAGNGYVYLRSKGNPNLVLDVAGTSTANGTNIILWNYNGSTNQKFKLS